MWRMKRAVVAFACLLTAAGIANAQTTIVGDWGGVLKAGGAELHLVLHIVRPRTAS